MEVGNPRIIEFPPITWKNCQTVGWIRMKLGTQVGIGPGHFVLDGDPAPLPQRSRAPNFRPISVVAKWLDDQDATWYGGRPRPRRLCVIWGPAPAPQKGGGAPKIFGPCLLWPNGWMDQDGTWHGGRPQLRRLCVRWGRSPLPKKGAEPSPLFSAHFYCRDTAG